MKANEIDFDDVEQVKSLKDQEVTISVSALYHLLLFFYMGGGEPDSLNARLKDALDEKEIV